MSDSVAIFVPDGTMIPMEEIKELTALETIAAQLDDTGRVRQYRVAWDDVTLLIEVPSPGDEGAQLSYFKHRVVELFDGRTDKKARKVLRRADRMVRALNCTVSPDWDGDRKAERLLRGIMQYYDYALMYANGTVYNDNGNIEVGHANSEPKYWAVDESTAEESREAIKRKKRSLKIIKNRKIPYIEHLPVIQDSSETTLRSEEAVAERAMALYAIVQRAEGESTEQYEERIAGWHIREAVSPEEWEFAHDDDPPEYMLLKMSQRMESYWLLLWVLGYTKQLNNPYTFANVTQATQIIESRSAHQFKLDAEMLSEKEILNAADLYYRYHWAVVEAELYGRKPPRGLEPSVVYERHYALNWLINYRNFDWDDVQTDT